MAEQGEPGSAVYLSHGRLVRVLTPSVRLLWWGQVGVSISALTFLVSPEELRAFAPEVRQAACDVAKRL